MSGELLDETQIICIPELRRGVIGAAHKVRTGGLSIEERDHEVTTEKRRDGEPDDDEAIGRKKRETRRKPKQRIRDKRRRSNARRRWWKTSNSCLLQAFLPLLLHPFSLFLPLRMKQSTYMEADIRYESIVCRKRSNSTLLPQVPYSNGVVFRARSKMNPEKRRK